MPGLRLCHWSFKLVRVEAERAGRGPSDAGNPNPVGKVEGGKKGSPVSGKKGTTLVAMQNLDKRKSGQPFLDVFVRCAEGMGAGKLIRRESRQDKEFHFQNWFKARLTETGLNFEVGGRNSYPDFRLVATTDGFEVKGLAYPGREANYDCNSQVPSGNHNGGRSTMFSGVIRPSRTAIRIPFWTWWSATATF